MEKEYYKTLGLIVNTPIIDNVDYEFEYHSWQYDNDPYLSKILNFLGIMSVDDGLVVPVDDGIQLT
jgi:hypothetical protein